MRVQSSLPEPLHIVDLKRMYHDIYDHYSAYDHPTTTGLQIFVHLAGDQDVAAVDGEPMRDREADLRPYWIAVFAFAQTLVVSNLASGRPSLQALRRALGTVGQMRELERVGRLAVTTTKDGGFNIGIAANDDDTASD
jgi:hypothetical protein